MLIRPELPSDETAIHRVTEMAFADHSHSNHTEAEIVRALRADGDLTVSLVAEVGDDIAGHIAFSPVTIEGRHEHWFGLGPLAVLPALQNQGVGAGLVEPGLADLRARGAKGCAVLGDPGFYGRFGFKSVGALRYGALPVRLVQWIAFEGDAPSGELSYARAFDLAGPYRQPRR